MERSFKLPKLVRKQKNDVELPKFEWASIVKTKKLGSGSFGSVHLAKHANTSKNVVIKKLKSVSIDSQTRFVKEAKILNSVKDHPNISKFLGFCSEPHSIMMEFSSFDFGLFGDDEKSVSSLGDFLQFVDEEFNFTSFADLLPVCAKDILSGLNYLHNHNIAHRDLKPSNILVCNQHLNIISRNDQAALEKAFGECPIVCRLTDFGLSRSADIQTKSIMASQTTAIGCGTPAYMAPEMQLNQLVSASQDDLKRADVWSLGLVMHNMVNSDIGSPYRVELEKFGISDTNAALKDLLKKRQLPQHSPKYELLWITSWWQIEDMFNQCAKFDATARPSTAELLSFIDKSLDNFFRRFPLSISQSTALEECDAQLAAVLQDGMPSLNDQPVSLLINDASNSCAFLSVGVCDRLLQNGDLRERMQWENVRETVESVVTHLPRQVNDHRDVGQLYDVEEAHSILSTNNLLYTDYDLSEGCVSMNKVFSSAGREEIMETLMSRTLQGHLHMGIYTCSPYIISIGVCEDAFFLVDTHPVGGELGGNGNGILLVTPDVSYRSCKSLVQWLLQRLKMAGVKQNQSQSIIWLTPRQGKLKQNQTMNFSL